MLTFTTATVKHAGWVGRSAAQAEHGLSRHERSEREKIEINLAAISEYEKIAGRYGKRGQTNARSPVKGPNFRSQLCSTAVERCPEHPGVLGGSMEQPYFVPDTSRGAIPEVPILGPPRGHPVFGRARIGAIELDALAH